MFKTSDTISEIIRALSQIESEDTRALLMKELTTLTKELTTFKTSDTIGEISKALSQFQSELGNVHKDKKGYSSYKYADLAAIYDEIRPLLAKNGLSYVQPISSTSGGDNIVTIRNLLMHSSGEYIQSDMTMTITNENKKMNEWQAVGTAITYLRRYSIASMLGIATTDDDAASAPPMAAKSNNPQDLIKQQAAKVNKPQLLQTLNNLIAEHEVDDDQINAWLQKADVDVLRELSVEQLNACIKYIKQKAQEV